MDDQMTSVEERLAAMDAERLAAMEQRRPSAGDMMASLAEEFMSDWTSMIFRDRCLAQIETAKMESCPIGFSEDPVESFLTDKSSRELEEFIFSSAGTRENYLSLIAEILMMYRKHRGRPVVNTDSLESASPADLVNGGMFGADNLDIPGETLDYATQRTSRTSSASSYTTTTTTTVEDSVSSEISNGVENISIETKKEGKSSRTSNGPSKSPTKTTPRTSPRKEVPNGIHHERKDKDLNNKAKKK